MPDKLTLTIGTRYFRSTGSEEGSVVTSFGCSRLAPPPLGPSPNPCVNRAALDIDALGLRHTYSGLRSRASLAWTLNDTAMLYTTWSQGFRAGGFNRGFDVADTSPLAPGDADYQAQAKKHKGFQLPWAYAPDNLTNTEVGWRSRWLNGHMQWNGTLYQEDWAHAQVAAATEFGGAGGITNSGTYRVRGIETSVSVHVADGWAIDAGAAWNHGRLIKEGTFYWNDGTPIDFSALRDANHNPVANLGGVLGAPLAGAPPFQGNIRVRYEREFDALRASLQVGAVHQAHSLAGTTQQSIDAQSKAAVYDLAPFTTLEGSVGVAKGAWSVQAYGENLTDTRAQLFANYFSFVKTVTVNRPRTLGLRMSYRFSGG